jgi:hypothetical protein
MSTTNFAQRVTIDLARFQQQGLTELAERIPLDDPEELLSVVISRGIVEILNSPILPPAEESTEAMGSMNSKLAFPSRMNMMIDLKGKEDWAELHARDAEYDRESARMNRDLGLAESPEGTPSRGRQVENHIGVPLSEGLRQGLEFLVNAYPDLEEENLYAALLEIGLKKVQEDPKALAPWAVAQKAGAPLRSKEASREQHRAEWKALCRNVARGWR